MNPFTANFDFPIDTVILGDGTHPCPGFAGGKTPGYGAPTSLNTGASSTYVPASATPSTGSSDLGRVFLNYLLGR